MRGEIIADSLLIDTCVWLDLAKDPSSEPVINALTELIEKGEIVLHCPTLIQEEFAKNKGRVAEVATQRLSQEFKRIRKVVDQFGEDENKGEVLGALDDIHHKLPILTDSVFRNIEYIENLFDTANSLNISKEIKLLAAERAINNEAPFHKNKNSMADAMIVEFFFDLVRKKNSKSFVFVTHNTKDFSSSSDNRKPHEDFHKTFQKNNVHFYINIVDVIKSVDKNILEDYVAEHEWVEETRGLYEILDHIDAMVEKVWFNRHCIKKEEISEGLIKIVPELGNQEYDPKVITSDIWAGALETAENVKTRYPGELGPFNDFEWGMLNGKLSALRWILGDDWDMLDT